MANLFRRKDKDGNLLSKKWYFYLNGQRKSTKLTNRKDAQRVADLMEQQSLSNKVAGLAREATLDEVVARFVTRQSLMSKAGKNNSQALQKRLLGRFPADELYRVPKRVMPFSLDPNRRWSSLTNADLDMIKTNRLQEGYANASIKKELDQLHQMQKLCRKAWGIKVNFELDFEDVCKLKVNKKTRAASVEEEEKLLEVMNPLNKTYLNGCTWVNAPMKQKIWAVDNFHLLVLYLDTGVRSAEGRKLLWDDVDTTNWLGIRVYRAKVDRTDILQLTDRLRDILKSRFKYREERGSDYIFPHAFDPKLHRGGSLGALRNGIKRAGLNHPEVVKRHGKFTVHSLRDSYATRLTEQGMIPSELMHLLGHANEEMSMKYIHVRPSLAIRKGQELRNESADPLQIDLDQTLEDAHNRKRR